MFLKRPNSSKEFAARPEFAGWPFGVHPKCSSKAQLGCAFCYHPKSKEQSRYGVLEKAFQLFEERYGYGRVRQMRNSRYNQR
jgi:hypothetical protein